MSLKQALEQVGPVRYSVCGVAKLRAQIDGELLAEFNDLLADHGLPATLLAKALSVEGHTLPAATIRRHRQRECQCGTV